MPLYEYRCADCLAKTTVLVRSTADTAAPACGRCGSRNCVRLFSRFAAPRSEESRLERMADPSSWGGLDENDPGSVSRFMKRVGREMGDEFSEGVGGGFDEMVDREMSGKGDGGTGDGAAESGTDADSGSAGGPDSAFGGP